TQRISGIFLRSSLVKITALKQNLVYPVQISNSKGKTLKDYLRSGQSLKGAEKQLSSYYYALKVFETMITHLEDEKEDNLCFEQFIDFDGQIRLILASIDADHLWVDPLLEKRSLTKSEVLLQLKSLVLCFKKILNEIDPRAIKTFNRL